MAAPDPVEHARTHARTHARIRSIFDLPEKYQCRRAGSPCERVSVLARRCTF